MRVSSGGPSEVGAALAPITLDDQHGTPGRVDEASRVLILSRDMEGGDVVKGALGASDQASLDARGVVYVADVSGMPSLVLRLFALPKMRDRPYRMLLDRDGSATRDLPHTEGKATVLLLDRLRVTRVVQAATADELRQALASD